MSKHKRKPLGQDAHSPEMKEARKDFIAEEYRKLRNPENAFDLTNQEHRQLLINQLRRELADSMTVALCVGDTSQADVVTIRKVEFSDTIDVLVNFNLDKWIRR
jgi:hypothetical protein